MPPTAPSGMYACAATQYCPVHPVHPTDPGGTARKSTNIEDKNDRGSSALQDVDMIASASESRLTRGNCEGPDPGLSPSFVLTLREGESLNPERKRL